MVSLRAVALVGALCLAPVSDALGTSWPYSFGRFRNKAIETEAWGMSRVVAEDDDPPPLYPERWIKVPIDHFHNDSAYEPHSHDTFSLRYWFDPTYYQRGGPVIVLQAGETSGEDRLPFLQKGILAKLAEATNGLGVVLEHRYYGKSMPFSDLTVEHLRFLSTDQAVADMAYFAQNAVFDGLEHLNLTAPNVAYLAYGGSYAGALVALVRKLYPDIYWGAISSSGVTQAIYDYWQYLEATRIFAPQDCVIATQKIIHIVDNILSTKKDTEYPHRLKAAFGLESLSHDDDFANSLASGVYGLQSINWDPAENSTVLGEYCNNISSNALLYPTLASLEPEAEELVVAGGYGDELDPLTTQILNYIGFVNLTVIQPCLAWNKTLESCQSSREPEFWQRSDKDQWWWRPWTYQTCTEWGYFVTGAGVPADQLPLISRLVDLEYSTAACRSAFNISTPPNVESINKHGGFNFSYPRLAIIDGERDPWRAATPHAVGLPPRESTASEPFILIKDGIHHWDEYGLFPNETTPELPPQPIVEVQAAEVAFVREWMVQWEEWNNARADDYEHGFLEDL